MRRSIYLTLLILTINPTCWAADFIPALEESPDSIIAVQRAALKPLSIDCSHPGAVIISVPHSGSLAEPTRRNVPIPPVFNLPGSIPAGIVNFLNGYSEQYLRGIENAFNLDDAKSTGFIFTGDRDGGKSTLVLSALWCRRYELLTGEKPLQNQIKAITFSASVCGDHSFNHTVRNLLGRRNIIDFSSYFAKSIECGVSIKILPEEQLMDIMRRLSYTDIIRAGAHNLGLVACSYILLHDLLNGNSNVISESSGLVDTDNACDQCNFTVPRCTPVSLMAAYSIYLSLCDLYKEYKYNGLPISEKTLVESFEYTQDNYYSNLNAVGSVATSGLLPLFTVRRGVGKWLTWLAGI